MPLTHSDIQTLRRDTRLINSIEISMLVASVAIAGEDPTTANHANRVALVGVVAVNSDRVVNRMASLYAASYRAAPSIDAAITDAAVESFVATVFNTPKYVALFLLMSGVTPV